MSGTTLAKNPDAFLQHDETCLETKLESVADSFLTPNELFFVRNNGSSPVIDSENYRLIVEGDAIDHSLSLSLDDIMQLPQRTLPAYIECAGNHRVFFDIVQGNPTEDTQWGTGGISMAEWTGVPLKDVLEMAGIHDTAQQVQLIGLDTEAPENGFRRPLPIDKALHPDTLLALQMNGEPLPRDHGFPIRVVVPGWVGSSQIKWLGKIVVSSQEFHTRNVTTHYVMLGDDYDGSMNTIQTIKSALALPWKATLKVGHHTLRGFAHSPHAPIAKVEWSADNGESWQEARLLDQPIQYAWMRFEFDWGATSGEHIIMTRATDQAGNTQPDEIPFNIHGYLFNQPLPHPIQVN